MIKFRKEGEIVENGLNIYPLNDKSSFGFIFRFGKKLPESNYREKAFFFVILSLETAGGFLLRA